MLRTTKPPVSSASDIAPAAARCGLRSSFGRTPSRPACPAPTRTYRSARCDVRPRRPRRRRPCSSRARPRSRRGSVCLASSMKPREKRRSDLRPRTEPSETKRAPNHLEGRVHAQGPLRIDPAAPVTSTRSEHAGSRSKQIVIVCPSLDHAAHVGRGGAIAPVLDPEGLVLRHVVGGVRSIRGARAQARRHREQVVAAFRDTRAPPGVGARGGERHLVPVLHRSLEERGHRAPRLGGVAELQSEIVEDDRKRAAGPLLLDLVGSDDARPRASPTAGCGSNRTASKLTIACGRPSSSTTKSSRVRPGTGWPFLSTTTTSTVISSTLDGNVGEGGWASAPDAARRPANPTADARAYRTLATIAALR